MGLHGGTAGPAGHLWSCVIGYGVPPLQGREGRRTGQYCPGRAGRPKKDREAAYLGEPFLGAVISNGLVGETMSLCI